MIKLALLGCGRIGQMHARNINNHPDFSLSAVYDVNKEFSEKIANELNVPLVNDDKIIFENKDIDAILIASSTGTHIEFIEKSVAANKPVYCEKPDGRKALLLAEAAYESLEAHQMVDINYD